MDKDNTIQGMNECEYFYLMIKKSIFVCTQF